MKNLFSSVLAASMAVSMCVPVFAVESKPIQKTAVAEQQVSSANSNTVPVTLEVIQGFPVDRFSISVPTSLPIIVDTMGNVSVATNAVVENHSTKAVKVSNVTVSAADGWRLTNFSDDFASMGDNEKVLGMSINNCTTTSNGLTYSANNFPSVMVEGSMPITYQVKLPKQTKVAESVTIANSVFVVSWA